MTDFLNEADFRQNADARFYGCSRPESDTHTPVRSLTKSTSFLVRMTIPSEYQRATVEFERFMIDARDEAGLATTNMAWNMVVGVFRAFRRRLSVQEAMRFANVLPAVLRAIFVADWDFHDPQTPFEQRESLVDEVRSVRREHNFSPDSAVQAVAYALLRNVDTQALIKVLHDLPAGAVEFWGLTRAGN